MARGWAALLPLLLLLGGAGPGDRAALMQAHRGGTLRLLARSGAGTIDPQVNGTAQYWQIFAATHDGLLAVRKVAGPAGREVVPDLAEAVPVPTDGGRSWVFRLRRGIRFSDGREVRPSDVAASFRRLFRVGGAAAGGFFADITGAAACLRAPRDCTLDGVSADDAGGTVSFRLDRPDSEFPLKLTLPPAAVLPADAPDAESSLLPLPGTGPYRIESYDPATGLRLARNPHFREWSADAQPDGYPDAIEYRFGLEDAAEVSMVLNNQADWLFDSPPADRLEELGTRHAALVHLNQAAAIWYLAMNTRLPPFNDLRVRQALNHAISRSAAVTLFGGPRLATETCQVLPPGLPGHVPHCPYGRDLALARRLVAESGTAGQKVTLIVDDSAVQRALGTYIQSVLRDIGFDAALRPLSGAIQYTYIQNSANQVQISLTSWYADYPAASDFLRVLFACAAFRPNSDSSLNIPGFCDPALDAQMDQAVTEPDADAAAGLWSQVDRAVTNAAPVAVLFAPRYIDLVSARVGNFIYNDQFHWLLTQSWVR